MDIVKFYSKRHREAMACALKLATSSDPYTVSALYLLTADANVWKTMKPRIKQGEICFENVKFHAISEGGYTLYTAAKDLYLGTEHMSIADLADDEMVHAKTYEAICTGIMLHRGIVKLPDALCEGKESRCDR